MHCASCKPRRRCPLCTRTHRRLTQRTVHSTAACCARCMHSTAVHNALCTAVHVASGACLGRLGQAQEPCLVVVGCWLLRLSPPYGLSLWPVPMACSCGLSLWPIPMACPYGLWVPLEIPLKIDAGRNSQGRSLWCGCAHTRHTTKIRPARETSTRESREIHHTQLGVEWRGTKLVTTTMTVGLGGVQGQRGI